MNATSKVFLQLAFIMLMLTVLSARVIAADNFNSDVIKKSLESIEFQTFTAGYRGEDALSESIKQAGKHRSAVLQCIASNERELQSKTSVVGQDLVDQLDVTKSLSQDEATLSNKISQLKFEINECKLLLEKSNEIIDRLRALQIKVKTEKLIKRDSHIFSNLAFRFDNLFDYIGNGIIKRASSEIPKILKSDFLISGSITALLFLFGGIYLSRKSKPSIDTTNQPFFKRISKRFIHLTIKWLPFILPATIAILFAIFFGQVTTDQSYLLELFIILLAFVIFSGLIKAGVDTTIRRSPDKPKAKSIAKSLQRRLISIAILLTLWVVIFSSPAIDPINNTAHSLLQSIFTTVILLLLIELLVFMPKLGQLSNTISILRVCAIGIFSLCLVFEWLGYHSLSRFLWIGILLTSAAVFIFYLAEKLLRDLYDGIDAGNTPWQQKFRNIIGVADSEPVPGLIWLRLLSVLVLWIALVFAALKAWNVSDSSISTLVSYLTDGFTLGQTRIVPSNVLIGILVFSGFLMLFGWFKDTLDKKYLIKSRMDSGARDAMVTIAGYVGFVLAAIMGLSIAGFSFANLAIVAGALSLGIGFGLQNIVNNFVSGIILLFERPIRTGDWIVTGSTEGYVKKISVRSTEVQTFDRSDVIVPNSELISTQVTNWTLRDRYGRLTIPVGVAYGSDTPLVKQVLEGIPNDIPEIIKNRPQLPIKVFFRSFGDSTLNFELRCFVYDISGIIEVTSKLNFAIDKQFRDHNIEIAFPQLDVHVRNNQVDKETS